MAFTDHCDIYGAVNEEAFNRVAYHIMKQRPSLFNYGTQRVPHSSAMGWFAYPE